MEKLNIQYEAPECFIIQINAAQVLCQSGVVGTSFDSVEEDSYDISIW
ncbi:MAG: hypothetical protein SPG52_01785 [Candidatus Cryptobacteroides sp.]|nr:hypothetical protein [Candidatus Cryptobacteroides sp.]